jgi:AraC-like DNA-binding protein
MRMPTGVVTPLPSPERPIVAQVAVRPGPTELQADLHDGIEIGIMLEGIAERHFQDFVVPGQPGDVWLCAMWEPHGRRVVSEHSENVVLQFTPEFLGEEMVGDKFWLSLFAVPPRHRPWVKDERTRAEALEIGNRIRREIEEERRLWTYAIRLHVLRLLFVLTRDWDPPKVSGAGPGTAADKLMHIMPALSMVQQRRGQRITVSEAARECSLSASRFAVLFRQIMGVPFAKFSLRARLAHVAQRLLAADHSLDDIAAEAGFADASHLHRHFVKHYRQTPSDYRQRPGRYAKDVRGQAQTIAIE